MANNSLSAAPRTVLGKKVKALRRSGVTPANIYGHKVDSTAVQADTAELTHLLRAAGRNAIIDLTVEGEAAPRTVVVRNIGRNPVTSQILHIDFFQVSMTETMKAEVRVVLTGSSSAVSDMQGVLLQMIESVSVEGLPGDIPAEFLADVSVLTQLESSIHVRDLHIDETKVTVTTDPDVVVARVAAPRLAAAEEEEAAAAAEGAEAPAEGAEGAAPAEGAKPEEGGE
ncbi:MAG: 50S ribosomal protein L25 [Dehalococcoidia bacterium]